MSPKQLFQLAVRLVGLYFLISALNGLPVALADCWDASINVSIFRLFNGVVVLLWPFLVAYWFFRGAPPLGRIAYPVEGN